MSDDTITLRPARADDAGCLAVLGMQVFLDTYCPDGIRPTVAREVLSAFSVEAFEAVLGRPDIGVIVAERLGHLIGFAQWTLGTGQPLVRGATPAELDRLYVQEPHTGRGLGRLLLKAAERDAAACGADTMWLTPWVHNVRALRFYAALGYADLGSTLYCFEDERHENRVLARSIAAGG